MDKQWLVYMLRCGDDTLYTGITDDLPRRLEMHSLGKGAKYTRGRTPLTVVYTERAQSYSQALKREFCIKQLPRAEKLKLIETYNKTAVE